MLVLVIKKVLIILIQLYYPSIQLPHPPTYLSIFTTHPSIHLTNLSNHQTSLPIIEYELACINKQLYNTAYLSDNHNPPLSFIILTFYPITTPPSPLPHHHSPVTTPPSPFPRHHSPVTIPPSPLPHHHSPVTTLLITNLSITTHSPSPLHSTLTERRQRKCEGRPNDTRPNGGRIRPSRSQDSA